MSKQIHTIQSTDKEKFDDEVNLVLEYGCELVEGSYEVIKKNDDVVYSQVIFFDDNNVMIDWFSNGQIWRIGIYLDGKGSFFDYKLDGWSKEWYENGNLKSMKYYEDGELGDLTKYYDNGNKEKEVDYTGKNLSTYWYENGNRRSHGRLKKEIQSDGWSYDIRFGFWTHWYENGNIWKEGKWINGDKYGLINVEDGFWTYWYENGQKDYEVTFKDNEPKTIKSFHEDGSVTETKYINPLSTQP